jgi:hypothetical protein
MIVYRAMNQTFEIALRNLEGLCFILCVSKNQEMELRTCNAIGYFNSKI